MVHSTKAIGPPAVRASGCYHGYAAGAGVGFGGGNMAIDASLAALVDFEKLGQWMDGQGLPGGAIERVSSIAGGTQNILLRFARGGREYVLRRPPRHLRPNSNEALRREGRGPAPLRRPAGSPSPPLHPPLARGPHVRGLCSLVRARCTRPTPL